MKLGAQSITMLSTKSHKEILKKTLRNLVFNFEKHRAIGFTKSQKEKNIVKLSVKL